MSPMLVDTVDHAPSGESQLRSTYASRPERPLRVLTFSSIFPNVAEPLLGLFVAARAEALAGVADVQVMAPVPAAPPVPGLPSRYYRCQDVPRVTTRNGVVVHHPRFAVVPRVLKQTDPALMAAWCARSVLALRRHFPFDLIDAHWACPDGVAAGMLASLARVPYAVTVRGDDINVFAEEPARRPLIQRSLRRAARVIALSEELREKVIALGTRPERVAVIANGIDASRFHPKPRVEARRRVGIADGTRLLLSVGRLHTSKGFPMLVDALAQLGGAHANTRLVIVGDADAESDATPAIQEAIERCGMHGRVDLIGHRTPEELTWWYSAADLFCLATTREGSANVLFEALACGLPCVTTNVGGNRETVPDDRYGLLAAPEAGAFAAAIADGLTRAWDRDLLVRRAAGRGWDHVARECLAQLHLARSTAARQPD